MADRCIGRRRTVSCRTPVANCGVENEDENTNAEDERDLEDEGASSPSGLSAFASLQRSLASIDFCAIQAAQRALGDQEMRKLAETQRVIANSFARSIDFGAVADAQKALARSVFPAEKVRLQWAEALSKSIDFTSISDAIQQSTGLDTFLRDSAGFQEQLRQQTDLFAQLSEQLAASLPKFDTTKLRAALERWIPTNLRQIENLDAVATIAVEEGIPLSWVPRRRIVVALLDAPDSGARRAMLVEHQEDILDDCLDVLLPIEHEWAAECREAVNALRAGFHGPAQSHGSNIIDSIVLGLHGKHGRQHAKDQASEAFDDMPLQLAAENLSLRPLFLAFARWFPDSGGPPPDHFARHATAHAVGHAGVFDPSSALIAVMLATSLTVQYAPGESKQDGESAVQAASKPIQAE